MKDIAQKIATCDGEIEKAAAAHAELIDRLATGQATDSELEKSLELTARLNQKRQALLAAQGRAVEMAAEVARQAQEDKRRADGVKHLVDIGNDLRAALKALDAVMKAPTARLHDAVARYTASETTLIQSVEAAGSRVDRLPLSEWLAELVDKGGCPPMRHPAVMLGGVCVTHETAWQPAPNDLPGGVLTVATLKAASMVAEACGLSDIPADLVPPTEFLNQFVEARRAVQARLDQEAAETARIAARNRESQERREALEVYRTSPVGRLQKLRSDIIEEFGLGHDMRPWAARKLRLVHGALRQLAPAIADVLLAHDTQHGFKHETSFDRGSLAAIGDQLDADTDFWSRSLSQAGELALDWSGCPPFGVGIPDYWNDVEAYPTAGIVAPTKAYREANTIKCGAV
ncbi:MAG: hypothetical protein IPM37_21670 [Hahellaceae bacterium]|nr:hypothetical protein [Hahellaceae bacterium]